MRKNILVCVAHRDDETIGCGATIYRHWKNGDKVFCLSMTDGVGARDKSQKKDIEIRKKGSILASKILKFTWLEHNEKFLDNQLDNYPLLKIVKLIEFFKNKINPDIVYTHSELDLNIDHKVVSQATLTAFRPLRGDKCQKIISFEVLSSSDYSINAFEPNYFIDISKFWSKKKLALKAYGKEILNTKTSRTLKGLETLATYRGLMSGQKFSESFRILRILEK
jgi:LmbE family N-acetylglucosaminyl deacetylase